MAKEKQQEEIKKAVEQAVAQKELEWRGILEQAQEVAVEAQENAMKKIQEAEEKEVEREAERVTERMEKEQEVLEKKLAVEREKAEFEAERRQWRKAHSISRETMAGLLWQIRDRAREKARMAVVDREEGEEAWYERAEAWCEGWMEGRAESEQEE